MRGQSGNPPRGQRDAPSTATSSAAGVIFAFLLKPGHGRTSQQIRAPGQPEARHQRDPDRGFVDLDGTGVYRISTGIGFLDHMLEQLAAPQPDRPDGQGGRRPAYRFPPHDRGYRLSSSARRSRRRWATARASALRPRDDPDGRDADPGQRSTCRTAPIWSGRSISPATSSARWTPSCSRSGSRPSRNRPA